jgi:hypothetical protein
MGGESTDLSVQILQLALIRGLDIGQRIASLEHVWQTLEGHLLPVTQDGGVNAILRRELTNGFGFLQQLQNNLGFEGGSVRFFHLAILPNSGVLTVQILGSTIPAAALIDGSAWRFRMDEAGNPYDDVDFIDQLITQATANATLLGTKIDPNQVYVVGESRGAPFDRQRRIHGGRGRQHRRWASARRGARLAPGAHGLGRGLAF